MNYECGDCGREWNSLGAMMQCPCQNDDRNR